MCQSLNLRSVKAYAVARILLHNVTMSIEAILIQSHIAFHFDYQRWLFFEAKSTNIDS